MTRKKNKRPKKASKKGAPVGRPHTKPQPPAVTANQQQGECAAKVTKTDKWDRFQALTRLGSLLTWCFDKGAEAWEKMKGFNLPDNWPDLPG